jgi:uncharacterized protein (DUF1697 family)
MNKYIALFRGINVGGNNILPMKELVAVLEGLGLKNVRTYIQSGNVVFQTTADKKQKLAQDIGAAIGQSHQFVPRVLVLTVQEFQNALESNPYPEGENEPKSLHLFFLESSPAKPDLEKLDSLQSGSERFKLVGTVFYLHTPDGFGPSKLASNVEKALGVTVTARNWRSASAILALAMKEAP